jgi:NAD(P)-dependent dehydrogenase (short-subunit alcohol dehydrogenase family)
VGVRVVLVEPGSIDTDIWRGADEQFSATLAAMSEEHRSLYDGLLTGSRKLIRATAKRAAPAGRPSRSSRRPSRPRVLARATWSALTPADKS